MRTIKKIISILFLLMLYFTVHSIDYYICLGSFLDNNNAIEYSNALNKLGISTVYEKAKIKNKNFTRVLLNKKFTNLKDTINELNKLLNNEVIKKEKIKDLWIRPGKLVNIQNSIKTKLTSNTKNNVTKEKKIINDKKNEKNEKEKKVVIEDKSKNESNTDKITEDKKNIALEELNEDDSQEKIVVNQVEEKKEENITPEKNKYRIIDKDGYGNFIFASQPIEFGKEDNYKLKTEFTKPEEIYARSYFPSKIGKIDAKDFWHEIWINGKFIRKTIFNSPPDPDWDQIQIWISKDDYSDIINSLKKGEYKIIIWVLKNEIIKEEDKTEVKTKTIKLSKGEFTYIVP